MKISIIVPTKNEEKTLPYLINSIREQIFTNFKIIVADANSKDKTRKIAKNFGCKVVEGGSPSKGRNNGAKEALKSNAEILVFMDSDIILPSKEFLETCIKEFKQRKLDVAGTLQMPFNPRIEIDKKNVIASCRKSKDWRYLLLYIISNFVLLFFQNTKRPYMQQCMLVKKSVYKKLGEFDETIEFGEDSRYAQKAVKEGFKFGIVNKREKIFISTRRLDTKGFWKMTAMYVYLNLRDLAGHTFRINGKMKYFDA